MPLYYIPFIILIVTNLFILLQYLNLKNLIEDKLIIILEQRAALPTTIVAYRPPHTTDELPHYSLWIHRIMGSDKKDDYYLRIHIDLTTCRWLKLTSSETKEVVHDKKNSKKD